MGGNALKKVKTIRLEREKYLQYENEIISMIRPLVTHFYIPRTFPGKETFGDIDVVYMTEDPQFLNKVKDLFQSKDSFHNGDITSVEYNNFQVDFILSRSSYYENHCCFLDYNDFGGILGQMTSRYELKYGFDGLFLRVHRDHVREHHLGEILLSSDPSVIFQYLGLDFRRFKEDGFQTPTEMFDFLMECKYCSITSYTQENINTVHRRRLSHRPVYQQFIDYITSHPSMPSQPTLPYASPLSDHTAFLLDYFSCKDAYHELIRKDEEAHLVKAKFNGAIITATLGLEGKDIGKLIMSMKQYVYNMHFPPEARDLIQDRKCVEETFQKYLLNLNEEEIITFIREQYERMSDIVS